MRQIVYSLAFLALLTGCLPLAAASQRLVIEGTGDSQVILSKLAVLYETLHPGTRIVVPDSVGSGGGVRALVRGQAGLARTARALTPKEREVGLIEVPFAWSPIVFAAHPSASSVKQITIDQALGIYRGTIANWKELNGPDHKLYPVTREDGDSSRIVLDTYILSVLGRSRGLGSVGKVYYTTGDAVQAMVRNAYTIGYIPLSSAIAAQLHVFALANVVPDETAVLEKKYPLVTTFYLVRSPDARPLAAAFLGFVRSGPATDLMRSLGVFSADTTFYGGR